MKDYKSKLDMKEAIRFCEKNMDKLLSRLPRSDKYFPYETENENYVQIDRNILNGILNSIPEQARKKSNFKRVIGEPKAYFSKRSDKYPEVTYDINDAISETAIVPGKTSGENICLYEMDGS